MLWSRCSTVESLFNGLSLIKLSFGEIFQMFLMLELSAKTVVSILI